MIRQTTAVQTDAMPSPAATVTGLLAGAVLLAAALCGNAARAGDAATSNAGGPGDLNPVFAQLAQMPRDALTDSAGRGVDQTATTTATLTDSTITTNGSNDFADSAFSGSDAFAAVVQNTGSLVSINNTVVLKVNLTD